MTCGRPLTIVRKDSFQWHTARVVGLLDMEVEVHTWVSLSRGFGYLLRHLFSCCQERGIVS